MIEKLDHIGIAVKDIDDALKFYTDALGLRCTHMEDVKEQKVKTAFIPTKNVNLELLQSRTRTLNRPFFLNWPWKQPAWPLTRG